MRGPSVSRIVPPAAALSFSELESQFAFRGRVEAAKRSQIADCYAALHNSTPSSRTALNFNLPIRGSSSRVVRHSFTWPWNR